MSDSSRIHRPRYPQTQRRRRNRDLAGDEGGGQAARPEALRLFPDAGIGDINRLGNDLECLWLEGAVWAAGGFNQSTTTANPGLTHPLRVILR